MLAAQAGSTADSLVLLNTLQCWSDPSQLLAEVRRGGPGGLPRLLLPPPALPPLLLLRTEPPLHALRCSPHGAARRHCPHHRRHTAASAAPRFVPPAQAYRVLKPGGTLVFVQRVRGGPLQALLGGGGGSAVGTRGRGGRRQTAGGS